MIKHRNRIFFEQLRFVSYSINSLCWQPGFSLKFPCACLFRKHQLCSSLRSFTAAGRHYQALRQATSPILAIVGSTSGWHRRTIQIFFFVEVFQNIFGNTRMFFFFKKVNSLAKQFATSCIFEDRFQFFIFFNIGFLEGT